MADSIQLAHPIFQASGWASRKAMRALLSVPTGRPWRRNSAMDRQAIVIAPTIANPAIVGGLIDPSPVL